MSNDAIVRLLADENVPPTWVDAINKVAAIPEFGIRISATSVHALGARGLSDLEHLIYARDHGFVFLTCDNLRHQGGKALREELASRGGRVIVLLSRKSQSALEAVAKLMMHFTKWRDECASRDGIARFQAANDFVFESKGRLAARVDRDRARPD